MRAGVPHGASYNAPRDGIVLVDYDKCIGCKYCSWAHALRRARARRGPPGDDQVHLCVDRVTDKSLARSRAQATCVLACRGRACSATCTTRTRRVQAINERGGYALMPRWGAPGQPLPAAAADQITLPEDLQRAANPLKVDGKGPHPWCPGAGLRDLMNPAFSVVLLTTLIGAGREPVPGALRWRAGRAAARCQGLLVTGAAASVLLTGAGLVASFFHLGHPERAWQAAAMWRTSWLSRG